MHLGSFEEAETLLLEALNKVCTDYTAFATMGPLNLVKFVFYFHFLCHLFSSFSFLLPPSCSGGKIAIASKYQIPCSAAIKHKFPICSIT